MRYLPTVVLMRRSARRLVSPGSPGSVRSRPSRPQGTACFRRAPYDRSDHRRGHRVRRRRLPFPYAVGARHPAALGRARGARTSRSRALEPYPSVTHDAAMKKMNRSPGRRAIFMARRRSRASSRASGSSGGWPTCTTCPASSSSPTRVLPRRQVPVQARAQRRPATGDATSTGARAAGILLYPRGDTSCDDGNTGARRRGLGGADLRVVGVGRPVGVDVAWIRSRAVRSRSSASRARGSRCSTG